MDDIQFCMDQADRIGNVASHLLRAIDDNNRDNVLGALMTAREVRKLKSRIRFIVSQNYNDLLVM